MERIGFIGLGIMGKPMARHLLDAGFPLTVLNRSHAAQDELVAAGAQAGTSPKQVAQQSDVVITSKWSWDRMASWRACARADCLSI
jgi:2-hydroxy-3-oxopropionate reductase